MIVVLDFGSQYTQLIARRIRESKVYCEIHPFNVALEKITALDPKGIILSGGPASVYQDDAPKVSAELLALPVPILGICYGMGVLNLHFGGAAARADRREYGPAAAGHRQRQRFVSRFFQAGHYAGVDEPWRQDDELSQGLGDPGP